MTQRTARGKVTKGATKSRKVETIHVVIPMSQVKLQRLSNSAARAGMKHSVGAYLVACEKEFGHNLWSGPIPKVGGTE